MNKRAGSKPKGPLGEVTGVTICFDFDGVLHSYKSGWTGIDSVADEPVPGAVEVCTVLEEAGYELVVNSARFCGEDSGQTNHVFDNHNEVIMDSDRGKMAVAEWLDKYNFPKMKLVETKPPASLYVDDRGFRFKGDFKALIQFLKNDPKPSTWVPRVKEATVKATKAV